MKISVSLFAILMICLIISSPLMAQETEWEELDAYHEVMSKTYHPAEDGDFEPLKEMSEDLAEKAAILASSTIPESYDTPELKEELKTLEKESKALHKIVKKGKASNDEMMAELILVHQVFHKIMGMCSEDEHGDHEEHQEHPSHQAHSDHHHH